MIVDEDQVEVRLVHELQPAELAEGKDREAASWNRSIDPGKVRRHCRPQCADHRFRNGGKHRSGSIAVGHAAQDLDSDLELAVVCPAARDVERVLEIPGLLQHSIEARRARSEEHTSELQSLMRITDAVFCLKKK